MHTERMEEEIGVAGRQFTLILRVVFNALIDAVYKKKLELIYLLFFRLGENYILSARYIRYLCRCHIHGFPCYIYC
jgi:hypothetical protein